MNKEPDKNRHEWGMDEKMLDIKVVQMFRYFHPT